MFLSFLPHSCLLLTFIILKKKPGDSKELLITASDVSKRLELEYVNTTYCTPQSGIWGVISRVMQLYFHEPKANENIAYE